MGKLKELIPSRNSPYLESFFEDLRLGEKPEPMVKTYFLPKLMESEMELVERKDNNFMNTFSFNNPDVNKAKMDASESVSKFVRAACLRKTFIFEDTLPGSHTQNSWLPNQNIFNCFLQ